MIGWLGYFGISNTYKEVLKLEDWIRRRVRFILLETMETTAHA